MSPFPSGMIFSATSSIIMNSEISKVRKKGQGRTHILACLDLRLYVGTPVLHLLKQRCISSASDHRSNQIPKSKVLYFLNSFVLSPQLINCRSPNLHLVGQSIYTHLFQLLDPLQQLRLRRGQLLQHNRSTRINPTRPKLCSCCCEEPSGTAPSESP
jgi:hypothetical protein